MFSTAIYGPSPTSHRDLLSVRRLQSGADYIAAPAGSVNDEAVTAAADAHGMVMVHTTTRLFHH